MAQKGDTITYTYADGSSVSEDISSIDEITVNYVDGASGTGDVTAGAAGGRAENVVIDVSAENTLYIWVGANSEADNGRYQPGTSPSGSRAGGSTEISFDSNPPNNETPSDSDLPFLVGAGGGGTGWTTAGGGFFPETNGSGGGARGGVGFGPDGNDASSVAPPAGGDGAPDNSTPAEAGDGAVDNRSIIIDSGTTTKGGGSSPTANGEVKISYGGTEPPDPPSNLSAEVQ